MAEPDEIFIPEKPAEKVPEIITLSFGQFIDYTISPKHINYKFLHSMLCLFATKLNLDHTSIKLDKEQLPKLPGIEDPIYYEQPNISNVNDAGEAPIEKLKHKAVPKPDTIVYIPEPSMVIKPECEQKKTSASAIKCEGTNLNNLDGFHHRLLRCETKIQTLAEISENHTDEIERAKQIGIKIPEPEADDDSLKSFEITIPFEKPKCVTFDDLVVQLTEQIKVSLHNVRREILGKLELQNRDFKDSVRENGYQFDKIKSHNCDMNKRLKDIENPVKHYVKNARKDCLKFEDVRKLEENTKINVFEICKLNKCVAGIQNKLDNISEDYRYVEKKIKEIEFKIIPVQRVRDILIDLEELHKWQKYMENELEIQIERFELLKTSKANECDLNKLRDTKADKSELQLYTKLTFFKCVYEDFANGLAKLFELLMADELSWNRRHKEMRNLIDAKTDKVDAVCLKDQIEYILNQMNNKLNHVIKERLTSYTSAFKTQPLEDGRCIACTAAAKINTTQYPVPRLKGLRSYFQPFQECLCPQSPVKRFVGGGHTLIGSKEKLKLEFRPAVLGDSRSTCSGFVLKRGDAGHVYRTRVQKLN